jgi:hypothetical protein
MNKTPDLNAIMADYTQQVIAENRRPLPAKVRL